ncbi:MAG: prepilin peptidase [Pseudodesulfovibrio sp.]|nr:prepilin peptidase [Pseudodesulfovibrio sp.]
MEILVIVMLTAALLVATITDIRSQRIPNWLTFPLILTGLVVHTMHGGLDGLKLAGGGFAIGFIGMAIPYFLGVMGAGDVKLMAGVGAWLGTSAAFTAFLFTSLAGGVYALGVLLFHRHLLKVVWGSIVASFSLLISTRKFHFAPTSSEQSLPRLCYGVAIAVGSISAMVVHAMQTGSVTGGY